MFLTYSFWLQAVKKAILEDITAVGKRAKLTSFEQVRYRFVYGHRHSHIKYKPSNSWHNVLPLMCWKSIIGPFSMRIFDKYVHKYCRSLMVSYKRSLIVSMCKQCRLWSEEACRNLLSLFTKDVCMRRHLGKPFLWRDKKNMLWSDAVCSAWHPIGAWTFCHI